MIETRDRALLERILRRDPVWGGYGLGDLEEPYFARTRWFLSDPEGAGMVLLYSAMDTTAITYGEPGAVAAMFDVLPLPETFHIHVPDAQAPLLRERVVGELVPHLRMGLRAPQRRAVRQPAGVKGHFTPI